MRTVRDRLVSQLGLVALAAAILLGAIAVGADIRNKNRNDTISVTGSAKQRITSDYVIWDVSIASLEPTPQAAAATLNDWAGRVRSFLRSHGVLDSELGVTPVSAETLRKGSSGGGKLIGYRLSRSFEVRSARVATIGSAIGKSSELLEEGVPLESDPPQYIFTKLPSIRPTLLASATRDALARAKGLVGAAGGRLGKLRGVDVGVFQVTAPNSTEVSDYGEYDTSTLAKDVTAVVNVTFSLR
jgi:uncharacterized protein